MRLLYFGMKYQNSRNPLMKLLAKICLALVKRQADAVEREAGSIALNVPPVCPSAEEMLKKAAAQEKRTAAK